MALTVAAAMALSRADAAATQVTCGTTITTDTTLADDLRGCPNNGIVIGADDITLDLNGHVIRGDGEEFADCQRGDDCDIGVLNAGHDGVTVKNGTTRGFSLGVGFGRAPDSDVVRITATKNVFFGIFFIGVDHGDIRRSASSRNIPPEGDGIGLFNSKRVRIVHSSIEGNAGPGIHVGEDTARTLIKKNEFSNDSPAVLSDATRTEVRANKITGGGGILSGAPGRHNVIANNRVLRAQESIGVESGVDVQIVGNVILDARGGTGIHLGIGNPPFGTVRTTVARNEVRNAHKDAFKVYPADRRSVLKHNVAVGAGDDGFEIESPRTTLRNNRAVRNGDLGFEATRGVDAGKTNVARHNGDRRQCHHIACR